VQPQWREEREVGGSAEERRQAALADVRRRQQRIV